MNKCGTIWREIGDEQKRAVIVFLRSEAGRQLALGSGLATGLNAAAEELENPTWDDEPTPAPGRERPMSKARQSIELDWDDMSSLERFLTMWRRFDLNELRAPFIPLNDGNLRWDL